MEDKKLDYMIEVAHVDFKNNLIGWNWITIKWFFAFDYDSPESILKDAKKFYTQTKKDISTNGILRLVAIGKDVTTPILIKQSIKATRPAVVSEIS